MIEVINTTNNLNNNQTTGPNNITIDIYHLSKLSVAQPLVNTSSDHSAIIWLWLISSTSFEKGSYIE